ncbi:hypothetical protein C440_12969 [Haloferax mucosum ATCC BAA-1512]|uniref:Uncharacterized protein n=1 Tax=Haloferax mucosum ATCC BAA-1512 TaxID=662479 RepID=M0I3A0_9EURY|nr:hypothetical protein [Haloferax mucosum]ELZ91226.1 hypothetical protein C440_12969 [Haloferax mucosum ATCC BAA-1512]
MSPNRVYWVSFVFCGLVTAANVGLTLTERSTAIATVAAALVGGVVILIAVAALWYPGDDSVATEWGPLVYFVAGSAVLYTALIAVDHLYSVVT